MGPPDESRRFRLRVKLWPDAAIDVARAPLARDDSETFDASGTIMVRGDAASAASAALALVATMVRQTVAYTPRPHNGSHAKDMRAALAEVAGAGVPVSLWRGKDGWLVVHTATHEAWRTFCGTFLNRSIYRAVAAADAWRDSAVNALATTVLDTHPVDDAVGTCLTYGVAAAAVEGWRDCETAGASRKLADILAWAALIETGETI